MLWRGGFPSHPYQRAAGWVKISAMKFGAHCYIFTPGWSDEQLELLDQAADLGLEMFELALGDDVVFDPRLTGRRASALGLELVTGPGGAWPVNCDLSADDPADRASGLAWHRRQVDISCELGARAYAGALFGHTGVVKRRRPPPDEYPRTAEGLHALAEHGARRGVAIVLEPMSHFRTHLVNTPAQLLRLLALADHPNLWAQFDTYHMLTEVRDYSAALRLLGDRLYSLHACENDRGVPGGGLVPWGQVFQALQAMRYSGYIGLEAYNSSQGDFAFERGMFHDVCPDGAGFVRRGLAFLRAALASGAQAGG
jgi:D-psicose/D-tagatose/L-ribulose 3-epimerase